MANILVVDDDPLTIEVMEKGLGVLGHKVLTAQDGKEGFRKAFWRKVDIILLDVVMTGMSGIDLLKKIKSSFRTSHIPVIMLTGYDEDSFRKQAVSNYCEYYIVKGTGFREISDKIARVFQLAPKPVSGWPISFRW